MCIIAVSKKRKLSEEEFHSCFVNNPHGIGITVPIIEEGKNVLKVYKTSSVFNGWNFYNKHVSMINASNCTPYVVHFRFASPSIPIAKELIHPFVIDKFGTSIAIK